MVRSRDEILAALRSLKPELVRRFGVRELSLFGSFARGDGTAASGIDILVEDMLEAIARIELRTAA